METKSFMDEMRKALTLEEKACEERLVDAHGLYHDWQKLLSDGVMPEIPEATAYSWGSSLWPLSIQVPLDKLLLHKISQKFENLGWKVEAWRISGSGVSFSVEQDHNYRLMITINAYSYGEGVKCKIVKIAERDNTIVRKDGIYEIVCEEGAEEMERDPMDVVREADERS